MLALCRGKRLAEYRAAAHRLALAGVGLVLLAGAAQSQQMTEAQKSAIRSSCRSDYMSNCMSVKPGGIEALQCLQKNMARLSPACQTAVSAATPKAASAPPPPTPAPAAAPPTPAPPPSAPAAAAAAPAPALPPAPAAPAIVNARPPPAAVAKPARAKAAAPAPLPAEKRPQQAAAAPPPAATAKIEKLSLRARLGIIKFCRGDRQAVCSTVREGSGRIVACLAANGPSLSPRCRQFLAKALQ